MRRLHTKAVGGARSGAAQPLQAYPDLRLPYPFSRNEVDNSVISAHIVRLVDRRASAPFHSALRLHVLLTEAMSRMPDDCEFSYESGAQIYRCVAVRNDRPWGHGLKITRHVETGAVLDILYAVCHPEWGDFDEMQALSTTQLVGLAREKLATGDIEESLQSCREVGLRIRFTLSRMPAPTSRLKQWTAPNHQD